MKIEQMLSNDYCSEKQLGEEFYYIASSEDNSTLIKKLFLKLDYKSKFTSRVLTYGVLSTIENKQDNNFALIKQFMDKNNIGFDSDILTNALTHPLEDNPEESFSSIAKFMETYHIQPDRERMLFYVLHLLESKKPISSIMTFWTNLDIDMEKDLSYFQTIYNYANSVKRTDLADSLNDNLHIIKHSMNQDMGEYITFYSGAHGSGAELSPDGSLSISGFMGGPIDKATETRIYYSENPFLFHLEHFNPDKLDSFFQQNMTISSSVVTHGLIRSMFHKNNDSIMYLFSQPQCAEIIQTSSEIRKFIMSDANWKDKKEELRLALSILDSNENILDLNNLKNKMKP